MYVDCSVGVCLGVWPVVGVLSVVHAFLEMLVRGRHLLALDVKLYSLQEAQLL